MSRELDEQQLSVLSIPAYVSLNKVSVFPKNSSKKKCKKNKSNTSVVRHEISLWYRRSEDGESRNIKREFSGDEADILAAVQKAIDSIEAPRSVLISPKRKRTVLKIRSPILFPIASNSNKHSRGGSRPGSGKKKRNVKRVKRSLKKNMNYARARRRMWYEAEKGRKIQQSRLDRETRIDALKEALSGNSSLECLLVGEKTWNRAN